MKFSLDMLQARESILEQGIQQVNRYAMFYPKFTDTVPNSPPILYPYSVLMPGYGYDLIDHSMWSIIRKIPFRKTYTELQVSFMVGSKNYKEFVQFWDSLLTVPNRSNSGSISNIWAYVEENGVSPDVFDVLTTDNATTGVSINGRGGSSNYADDIISESLQIFLLDENDSSKINAQFIFDEVFVSQVAPIQLTSIETGYTTFQVYFKFAKVRVI